MTDPAAHYAEPDAPPSLASTLGKMAEAWSDAQGQMMFGAQWPVVKLAQAEQRRQAKAEAERTAKVQRWADLSRQLVVGYLLLALVALATAAVVWAWRVAL